MVRRVTLMVTLVLFGLAGCANPVPGPGSPVPATTPPPTTVTITRTGGFAGVHQSIAIAPDGSWVYTDARNTGASQRGQLTPAQETQLLSAVVDPAFADQLRRRDTSVQCSDGFDYTVDVAGESQSFSDCPQVARPVVDQALRLIKDATPF
jgi:hypothetical protein